MRNLKLPPIQWGLLVIMLALPSTGFTQLEEIIVTAQKRSESLQDVPIAVSAFDANALESKGITNISEIGEFTPNVTIDNTSSFSGSTQVLSAFIRGIGQSDFAFNLDPGVGIYVDGVYYARSFGAVTDLLDLERVEVLKGPQGTLFGRNTIGGALNIITRKPADKFQATGDITAGSYDRLDVRGAVDIPIRQNLLSQISFSSKTRGGFHKHKDFPLRTNADLEFTSDGGRFIRPDASFYDEAGGENTQNIRAKLEWLASDTFNATFSVDYLHADEQGSPSQLLAVSAGAVDLYNLCVTGAPLPPSPPAPSIANLCMTPRAVTGVALQNANTDADPHNDRVVINQDLVDFTSGTRDLSYPGGAGYSKANTFGLSATLDWYFSENFSLKAITAYRDVEATFALDVDGTPVALGDHAFDTTQEQWSQEFQLTGNLLNSRLDWVLGAYLFHEEGDLTDYVHFAGGLLQILGPNNFETDAQAVFTHLNYAATDKLGLTFGARYTVEDKEFEGLQRDLNSLAFLLGTPLSDHPDPTDTTLYFPPGINQRDFDNLSFRAGIEYKPTDNVLTYLSFSQGYKSGGWTTRATVPISEAPEFDEETADTYEFGLKMDLFDNRVRANLAIFFTDYQDLQVTVYQGISPVTENAAQSEIKGFEFEIHALPTDRFEILAAIGYTDAQYKDLDSTATELETDFLFQNTPKWSTSLTGIYTIASGSNGHLTIQGDWTYRSEIANSPRNHPVLQASSVSLFSAVITYTDYAERYTVAFGGRNLTDERFVIAGQNQTGIGYVGGTYNRPQELYVRAGFKF